VFALFQDVKTLRPWR